MLVRKSIKHTRIAKRLFALDITKYAENTAIDNNQNHDKSAAP